MTGNSFEGRYFLSRKGYGPVDVDGDVRELAGFTYWNHWQRRMNPYKTIREGDTIYLMDEGRRALAAELRVANLVTTAYDTLADGWEYLYRVFGITEPRGGFTGYDPADGPGFLLAFETDVVRPLDIPFPFPWDRLGGRHGWISLPTFLDSDQVPEAEKQRVISSLPSPGEPAIAQVQPVDTAKLMSVANMERAPRQPTSAVKRAVLKRSTGKCEMPSCQMAGSHFDHVVPWSKGGNSSLQNIQFLCQAHNLSKSDTMPDTWQPDQMWIDWYIADSQMSYAEIEISDEDQLTSFEVRTAHSRYFVVRDEGLIYIWKRGHRLVGVANDPGDALFKTVGDDGERRLAVGDPTNPDGGYFYSSVIDTITDCDPVEALRGIGVAPGDTILVS